MNSTDPSTNSVNKNSTDYVEELHDVKTVSATNDPPKVKPQRINRRQIKSGTKIGRNDPCPCGSGIKYKKCHLKKQQEDIQKQIEMRRQIDGLTQESSESKSEETEVSQTSD